MKTEKFPTYGRDDLMVIAAFRYCLGRKTYIVSDCVEWLIAHWDEFQEKTQHIIKHELEMRFLHDDNIRAGTNTIEPKPLGMDCDRAEWEKVRALWEPQAEQE